MKITDIEFRSVGVPYRQELLDTWPASGTRKYQSTARYPMTILWVHTDEGITGIGEAMQLDEAAMKKMKSDYVGRNLWEIALPDESPTMQCVLYDIAGQALGVPMHQLMGTKCRDRVELVWWSPPMTPEATVAEAERGAKLGYRVHKLKARPDTIVEIAELTLKACGPDFRLRVDPNTHFNDLPTAVQLARELLPYNVEVYEDPIPFDDPSWYRQLRAQCEPPVARHFGSHKEVLRFIKAEAVDSINNSGSPAGIRKNAAIAEAAGIPIWMQIFAFGSAIGTTYAVHMASTIANCTMPLDELPHLKVHNLAKEGFDLSDGAVTVPDAPGLGITLDMDAIEKYRIG